MGRSEDPDGRSLLHEHLPLWLVIAALTVHRSRAARAAVPEASAVENERDADGTAWRIHALLVDWIGKSDQKASFALAVESAVVIGIITASDRDPRNPKLLSTLDTALEL